eukprot:3512142-Rhodomonas_salina.1
MSYAYADTRESVLSELSATRTQIRACQYGCGYELRLGSMERGTELVYGPTGASRNGASAPLRCVRTSAERRRKGEGGGRGGRAGRGEREKGERGEEEREERGEGGGERGELIDPEGDDGYCNCRVRGSRGGCRHGVCPLRCCNVECGEGSHQGWNYGNKRITTAKRLCLAIFRAGRAGLGLKRERREGREGREGRERGERGREGGDLHIGLWGEGEGRVKITDTDRHRQTQTDRHRHRHRHRHTHRHTHT